MPNRNKRQQLQAQPAQSGFILPYPWTQSPPWQQVPWQKRNAAKGENRRDSMEAEVK